MGQMNGFGYLVMIVWIPVVLYLFSRFPARRALIISFLGAWLFLPEAKIPLSGVPDYTKMSATCYGIFIATLIFDPQRFKQIRLHWIDIPMLVWCFSPMASSLANGLGPYDGFAEALSQTVTWGFPYWLGRLYLGSLESLKQLAVGIVGGGLLYVPLCLFEIRMSPQLHKWLYGFYPQSFDQALRYGGFRPFVFMQHGLMVGMWLMTATLIAFWLWHSGTLQATLAQRPTQPNPQKSDRVRSGKIPHQAGNAENLALGIVLLLGVTFVLEKSTGAYFLLLLAGLLIFSIRQWKTALLLFLIPCIMSGYLIFASVGGITPQVIQQVSSALTRVTNEDRAASLVFRLENEARLSAKARQQPWLGWGGWGRARIYDNYGNDISVTDSLWIIAFGNQGIVGLVSLMSALILPVLGFVVLRCPAQTWNHPQVLPAAVLAVALMMYTIDCLINAMVNPIYTLVAGGLAGIVAYTKRPDSKPSKTPRSPTPFKFPQTR
jgi:hypothetical protein